MSAEGAVSLAAWGNAPGFKKWKDMSAESAIHFQLEAVLQYVEAQQEHHRTRTFQEEYRELLRKHGIDFDERYIWD